MCVWERVRGKEGEGEREGEKGEMERRRGIRERENKNVPWCTHGGQISRVLSFRCELRMLGYETGFLPNKPHFLSYAEYLKNFRGSIGLIISLLCYFGRSHSDSFMGLWESYDEWPLQWSSSRARGTVTRTRKGRVEGELQCLWSKGEREYSIFFSLGLCNLHNFIS